ncbi:MAG: outer membrane lipoprotein LolB [Gammaproteobacteria bacterium]|nr:outer membrane lipoprotein LolB [Gammaproteobacteria bacterium]
MNENFRQIPIESVCDALLTRFATIALGIILLSSCAVNSGAVLPPLTDWDTRRDILSNTDEWAFTGRIGVSAGTEGFNGKLRWNQVRNGFSATLSGPLGAGVVKINGDSGHVTVVDREGREVELTRPEEDLRRMYGWTIPVTSLRYWALGIPDPAGPAVTEFGDSGQLVRLEQGNWRVSISQYREGGGQLMPRRITAVNGDAKVRLVIDRWTFF